MYTIKTVYHIRGEKSKVTRSVNANRAVTTCIAHMQVNDYGAHLAEVYDEETGDLHAQIKQSKDGSLHIYYKRDPMFYKPAASYVMGI